MEFSIGRKTITCSDQLLGHGSFSEVYMAKVEGKSVNLAVKHIKMGRCPQVCIYNEIKLLQLLGGKKNVIAFIGYSRTEDVTNLYLEHFPHVQFQSWFRDTDAGEIKKYMHNLLLSLDYLAQNHVIHRDIKPANFLYQRGTGRYALVDFGLSEFYTRRKSGPRGSPGKQRSPRKQLFANAPKSPHRDTKPVERSKREPMGRNAKCTCRGLMAMCGYCTRLRQESAEWGGTAGYRAPEILFRSQDQSYAIDVYAAGVTLLSLLTGRYPAFKPATEVCAILQIAQLLGTEPLKALAKRLGKSFIFQNKDMDRFFPTLNLRVFCEAARCWDPYSHARNRSNLGNHARPGRLGSNSSRTAGGVYGSSRGQPRQELSSNAARPYEASLLRSRDSDLKNRNSDFKNRNSDLKNRNSDLKSGNSDRRVSGHDPHPVEQSVVWMEPRAEPISWSTKSRAGQRSGESVQVFIPDPRQSDTKRPPFRQENSHDQNDVRKRKVEHDPQPQVCPLPPAKCSKKEQQPPANHRATAVKCDQCSPVFARLPSFCLCKKRRRPSSGTDDENDCQNISCSSSNKVRSSPRLNKGLAGAGTKNDEVQIVVERHQLQFPGFTNVESKNGANQNSSILVEEGLPDVLKSGVDRLANLDPCVYDLLERMLCADPTQRISAAAALDHEWFSSTPDAPQPSQTTG